MIKDLKYSVTFTSPERTISRDLNFQNGLTAITGPNGTGKSLVLEMIQYALFGTKALRAPVAEYKKIDVTLNFSVRDEDYIVERSLKRVTLRGTDLEVSGTTAVNAAILSIFGYSYDVFRVANVAAQGEIEALGNMKPTERKRLVDETVGLNALDDVTLFIQEHVRTLGAEVKALDGMLVEPVAPEDPQLKPKEYYAIEEKELQKKINERNTFQAILDKPAPVQPLLVEPDPEMDRKDFYVQQNRQHESLLTEKNLLEKDLGKLQDIKYVEVQLDPEDGKLEEYQEIVEARKTLKTLLSGLPPKPEFSLDRLYQEEEKRTMVARWRVKQQLLSKRVHHQCPACSHEWNDEDPRIKSEYGDVPDNPPQPELSEKEVREQTTQWEAEPKRKELEKSLAVLPPVEEKVRIILVKRKLYQESQVAREHVKRRKDIQERLQQIEVELINTPGRTKELDRLWKNELAVIKYMEQLKTYSQTMSERKDAEIQLQLFPGELDQQLALAKEQYQKALQYELEYKRYTQDLEKFQGQKQQLDQSRAELKDWENGKKAIVDLRAKVKGYLLPSLNTVASILINEMTGGVLSWIRVDEDFEIEVEGQKLETLSGSGKAVANLALRIGLGQILTNRVMSTLMLDEIDASCDQERAQYIAGCLQRLTGSIRQLIQVSHKQGLQADHHINLGGVEQ